MQKSSEIKSAVENIRYYALELKKLVEEQLKLDFKKGDETGFYIDGAAIRFQNLQVIYQDCGLFELYMWNIEAALKNAEEQDKTLNKTELNEKVEQSEAPF